MHTTTDSEPDCIGETTTTIMTMTVAVSHGNNEPEDSRCEGGFTFGQTLRKTFGLLWDRLDIYTGLYAVIIPFLGLYIGMTFAIPAADKYPVLVLVLALLSLVVELACFPMAIVAAAAIVYTTACVMQGTGSTPSFCKAIKVAGRRLCTLAAATTLMTIPEVILTLTCIAFSMEWDKHDVTMCVVAVVVWMVCGVLLIWMILGSTCLVPSIMIGHLGPLKAIRKSFGLACGNYLYLFCIVFTLGALEQGFLAMLQLLVGNFGPTILTTIYLQSALVVGPLLVFPALSSV